MASKPCWRQLIPFKWPTSIIMLRYYAEFLISLHSSKASFEQPVASASSQGQHPPGEAPTPAVAPKNLLVTGACRGQLAEMCAPSVQHVSSWDENQVVRLAGQHPYPGDHLASPDAIFRYLGTKSHVCSTNSQEARGSQVQIQPRLYSETLWDRQKERKRKEGRAMAGGGGSVLLFFKLAYKVMEFLVGFSEYFAFIGSIPLLLGPGLPHFWWFPAFLQWIPFPIARKWNQSRCLSTHGCIRKMQCIHTMEFYMAGNRGEIMSLPKNRWCGFR